MMVEFDHANTLLQIPGGHFASMVQQTGPSMSSQLLLSAKEAFKKKESN
jgi:hypothetical protein